MTAVQRSWGTYTVLNQNSGWVVKQLSFDIGKSLSDQRHFNRSEHWHIVEGTILMDLEWPNGDKSSITYNTGDSIDIPRTVWHKATNVGQVQATVIEVWLAVNTESELTEDDIERRD